MLSEKEGSALSYLSTEKHKSLPLTFLFSKLKHNLAVLLSSPWKIYNASVSINKITLQIVRDPFPHTPTPTVRPPALFSILLCLMYHSESQQKEKKTVPLTIANIQYVLHFSPWSCVQLITNAIRKFPNKGINDTMTVCSKSSFPLQYKVHKSRDPACLIHSWSVVNTEWLYHWVNE